MSSNSSYASRELRPLQPVLTPAAVPFVVARDQFVGSMRDFTSSNAYFSLRHKKYIESLNYSEERKRRDIDTFVLYQKYMFNGLKTVRDLLHDYDYDVLDQTCAVGIKTPSHGQLEETLAANFTIDKGNPFSAEEVAKAILAMTQSEFKNRRLTKDDMRTLGLSFRRASNQAYPIIVSGSNRKLSNFFLGVNVLHAWALDALEIPAASFDLEMARLFGPQFYVPFVRNSHVKKELPMATSSTTWMKSSNFEPRVRSVEASPKVVVIKNRLLVKVVMDILLKHPWFNPDPLVRHPWFLKQNGDIIASDHSKFDLRHGGDKLDLAIQVIEIIGRQVFSSDYMDRAMEYVRLELQTIPIAKVYHSGVILAKPGMQVASGSSFTTVLGCISNFVDTVILYSLIHKVTPSESLRRVVGDQYRAKLYGDDGVIVVPRGFDVRPSFKKFEEQRGLSIDVEPFTKFLGSYYDNQFRNRPHYSLGRAFQGIFFPERAKNAKAMPLAIYARLSLMQYSTSDKARIYESIVSSLIGLTKDPAGDAIAIERKKRKYERLDTSRMSSGHILSSDLSIEVIRSLPSKLGDLKMLVDDMLKNPDSYGLGSAVGDLDDILQIYTHGLSGTDAAVYLGAEDAEFFDDINENINVTFTTKDVESGDLWKSIFSDKLEGAGEFSDEIMLISRELGLVKQYLNDTKPSDRSLSKRMEVYRHFLTQTVEICNLFKSKKVLSGGSGGPFFT